jgi:uncharacterized protein (TIGR02246 family)
VTWIRLGVILLALTVPTLVVAEDVSDTAIRAVLEKQVQDWNRGDIPAFVQTYAENCTFVGTSVVEGRAGVEARYRRSYPTLSAMGHLAFSDLKIKKIDSRVAIVTGAFHLQRPGEAGGDKNGIFSLVFERERGVWRIVLDHTSAS